MKSQDILKRFHVASTTWFVACAVFLLIVALRQAGFRWWVVFSFSGYSVIVFIFLVNVYVFAIFRGVARSQNTLEHPLTTSIYYITFYDLCPFLGSVAGLLSAFMIPGINFFGILFTIAEGTLSSTFLVWIVFDPVIGIMEYLIPECAGYRRQRLAEEAREKQKKQQENQKLLESLEEKEARNIQNWNEILEPVALKLAELLPEPSDAQKTRMIAHEAGAKAWQLGGIVCMRHLHQLVRKKLQKPCVDFLAVWWDGIGDWRKPSFEKTLTSAK